MEIWKIITDFPNYSVSNLGNIINNKNKFVRKLQTDKDGYKKILLRNNNKGKLLSVHRLVAIEFILNPENKPQVNHKDNNRSNNNKLNLEWMTNLENTQYCVKQGRKYIMNGDKNGNHKLDKEDVNEIRKSSLSIKELASVYNMSFDAIYRIVSYKSWKD